MQQFLARVSSVPSINMLNLAILDATNSMTPVEAMQVFQNIVRPDWQLQLTHPKAAGREAEFTAALRYAMSRNIDLMRTAGKPRLERFRSSEPIQGIRFFSDGTPTRDKSLLICFAGNGGRMMMPLPAFLQHIDSRQADVVLLADPTKRGFRNGIAGIAPTIVQVAETVARAVPSGYRDLKVMGTSAGGLPALLFAGQSATTHILAIGPGHPDDERWPLLDGVSLRQLLTDAAPKLAGKQVVLAYGADATPDPEAAEALKTIIPNARPLAVTLEGKAAEHSFLADLCLAGRFLAFLEENLGFEAA